MYHEFKDSVCVILRYMFQYRCKYVANLVHFSFFPATPVITALAGNTIIGVEGRRISLHFIVLNALPAVTAENIRWFFESTNGSQIELTQDSHHSFSSHRLSLTIDPLVLSDEGNYSFQVNHITGAVTSTVFLEIQSQCTTRSFM